VVIGVSPDTAKKHCRFKEKYDLAYTLIADTDHRVCEAYGVWQQKSMFGHKYMGVVRTTFLIDPEGRIARVFEGAKPEEHATEVLGELLRRRG
jgi:peroxiredoxin Q/BCP